MATYCTQTNHSLVTLATGYRETACLQVGSLATRFQHKVCCVHSIFLSVVIICSSNGTSNNRVNSLQNGSQHKLTSLKANTALGTPGRSFSASSVTASPWRRILQGADGYLSKRRQGEARNVLAIPPSNVKIVEITIDGRARPLYQLSPERRLIPPAAQRIHLWGVFASQVSN